MILFFGQIETKLRLILVCHVLITPIRSDVRQVRRRKHCSELCGGLKLGLTSPYSPWEPAPEQFEVGLCTFFASGLSRFFCWIILGVEEVPQMAGTVDPTTLLKVQFSHSLVTDGYRRRTFELGSSLFQNPQAHLKRLRPNAVNVRSLDAIKSNRYLRINAATGGTKFGTNIFKVFQGEEDNVEEDKAPKGFFLALRPKVGLQLFRPRPDSNTVFVAGATGLTGARVVLELLHEGYKVRAGVDDLEEAQQLAKIAAQYEVGHELCTWRYLRYIYEFPQDSSKE